MFTTINETKLITGKNVSQELLGRAQFVIESYIGKFQDDISNSKDLEICKRAVAYQAAYMLNNEDVVFEQMSVSTTGINDAYTTFKDGDDHSPFVSPMAVMSCRMLSFVKSRSLHTGKTFYPRRLPDWYTV